jgi:hypothetical protein
MKMHTMEVFTHPIKWCGGGGGIVDFEVSSLLIQKLTFIENRAKSVHFVSPPHNFARTKPLLISVSHHYHLLAKSAHVKGLKM